MNLKNSAIQTLSVFSSLSTLVCCALPALLVSLGAGAVMAGLVSAGPQLVWLSEHKVPLFLFAGSMLVLSGISSYRNRDAPCPVDIGMRSCLRLRRWSRGTLSVAILVYAIGFFFAFILSWIAR